MTQQSKGMTFLSRSAQLQLEKRRWGRIAWLCGVVLLMSTAMRSASAWLDHDEIERACVALYDSGDDASTTRERNGGEVEEADDAGATAERRRVCTAYLQGFLAGVIVKDRALRDEGPAVGEETFSERAARTRGGGRTATILGRRGEGPLFCIGESVSAADIVAKVEEYFEALALPPEGRYEALHEALVAAFPCDSQ